MEMDNPSVSRQVSATVLNPSTGFKNIDVHCR